MSNLTKLEFVALDISGKNYLSWTLDAEIHLEAMNLGETIKENNNASLQDRAKSMIFLRHHLHEELKTEYLTVKDPLTLWKNLKERYEHQKTVILPKARYDWIHLRLQDFKSSRPTGSVPFPEANVSSFHGHGRRRGRRRRGGRNRNNYNNRGGHNSSLVPRRNSTPSHQKWNSNATKQTKEKALQNKAPEIYDDKPCYRCGIKGHWSRTCRTPKHLVDLYRASMNDKGKGKEIEMNFVDDDLTTDITHFDVSDFFADTSGNSDHLIGDGNVQTN
ncbi:uncharacterized protein LOC132305076 [Cornus florida]|uniref:uncharacterized protein LOC132305076 n=1 Tax=Cornus florida TaxID=4283 RepID=UPI0028A0EB6C|nr:uncharacterized protein LOC132305076 [Cornus florida]